MTDDADPCGRRDAVGELAQAIRLTREYVGEELLPPVEGWSWYDALRRHAPHELPDGHRPEADFVQSAPPDLHEQLADARSWARHGYEIGQKHCSWSDHGVAPAWLTEGWPPHIESCEFLKRAAEYDEALARVRAVACDPDTYEDAADVIRAVRDAIQGAPARD